MTPRGIVWTGAGAKFTTYWYDNDWIKILKDDYANNNSVKIVEQVRDLLILLIIVFILIKANQTLIVIWFLISPTHKVLP